MKNNFGRSFLYGGSLKFIFIFLLCCSSASFAESNINNLEIKFQERTINGTVSDTDGNLLPGVSVLIKGTSKGTTTDFDGNFKLNVSDNDVLVFSYLGYATKETLIGKKVTLTITLEQDVSQLDEIVVVGYGTVKKKDLTGAVSVVGGEAIASIKTPQVAQALQGSVSGVTVNRSNGPGASASIRIRGITTLSDSNPLTIVDGVPGELSDINPNDIESISVLKDAASASIYGARAASGVILVTTKRAKTGQSSIEYSFEFGFEKPTKLPETVGVQRYLEMVNELNWNDNGNNEGGQYSVYSQDEVENWTTWNQTQPNLYPVTDWESLILKKSAPRKSHRISFTSGGKNVKTKFTAAYDEIDALYENRTYKRLTTRINNNVRLTDKLKATFDVSYKRTITDQPNSNPLSAVRSYPAIYAALWSDGRIAEGKQGANAYAPIHNGGFNKDWYNTLFGNVSITYEPIKDFTIKAVVSPTLTFDKGKQFKKAIPYYDSEDPTVFQGYIQGYQTTSLQEVRNDSHKVTKQFLLNYNKSFNEIHDFNALLGYEDFERFSESLGASRDQYELLNYPYLNLGPLELRDNSGSANESAYRSYFGRVKYSYKNKYFLQANLRTDISSRFHKDHRSATFPSASLGWVVSEEEFMKNQNVVSFLKIRASYGELGNERIGNYPYQALINFGSSLFYQGGEIVSATTASENKEAILDLTWETTSTSNIGVDLSFLNNRLNFTGDYFYKETSDMLLSRSIFDFIGKSDPEDNVGTMNTKGWDAQITWKDRVGDFGYSISANISDSKTKMGNLDGKEFLGSQAKIEGSEFNEWYGYISDGFYETQEDLDEGRINNNVTFGDIKYVDISGPDIDGDGIGDPDGKITSEYDRVLLGGSLPRYMYGGNIKIDYKGFDFGLVFQGVGKRNVRVTSDMVRPIQEQWQNAPAIIDGKYWSVYNTEEENANAIYPRLSHVSGNSNNYNMSDFWLINGAYFRLKNISLGYTLPNDFVKYLGVQKVHLYATGSDLLSIDNYPDGWDPEATSAYPITKSFVFGATIKF